VWDLAFWWTRTPGWATGALWLLGGALIMAALAAAAGLTDFLGDSRIRDLSGSNSPQPCRIALAKRSATAP
jgi:uncharacterized membrane protein